LRPTPSGSGELSWCKKKDRVVKTAVVIIADEAYVPPACCAAISCRSAGRFDGPIFLLVTSGSEDSLETARRFLNGRRLDVQVMRFEPSLSDYRVHAWITPTAYARLHLDEIFDSTWDRLLYLDADTRVRGELQPLFATDLDGRILGAVNQCWQEMDQKHLQRLSMAPDAPYFNSGVLLFDWPKVLSSGLLPATQRFAIDNPELCETWDQDALNKIFEGRWKPLLVHWNYSHKLAEELPRERALISHYSFRYKPWSSKKNPFWFADALWYWRTLRDSPWPDFVRPITARHVVRALQWNYATRLSKRQTRRLSRDGCSSEAIDVGK
jgi:lipopolysaccharide biosynthesis glycosyltransferase